MYEKSPTDVIHVGVINVPYIHIDLFGVFDPLINLLPSLLWGVPDLGEDVMFCFVVSLFFVLRSEQLTNTLMEKMASPGILKNFVNDWINYLSTSAQFLPSTQDPEKDGLEEEFPASTTCFWVCSQ